LNFIKVRPNISGSGSPLLPGDYGELIAYLMQVMYAFVESNNDAPANVNYIGLLKGEGRDKFADLAMMNEKILNGQRGGKRMGISSRYVR